jgi:hypothetical protein
VADDDAVAARAGDYVLRLPLSPSAPSRSLLAVGQDAILILTGAPGESTEGEVVTDVLVLDVTANAVALSVPQRYATALARLGVDDFILASDG